MIMISTCSSSRHMIAFVGGTMSRTTSYVRLCRGRYVMILLINEKSDQKGITDATMNGLTEVVMGRRTEAVNS